MKQIFNWTIGSFFRTIGRTIAFLAMGGLIYYILSSNGFEFGIKDLFFENVKASTYNSTGLVSFSGTGWGGSTVFSPGVYSEKTMNTVQTYYEYVSFDKTITKYDQMIVNGYFSGLGLQPDNLECNNITSNGCESWSSKQYGNIEFTLWAGVYAVPCTIHWNDYDSNVNDLLQFTATCPFYENFSRFYYKIYVARNGLSTFKFGLNKNFILVNDTGQGTINAIDQQTQQQQQNHEETQSYLEDSNTTQAESEATDFFEDFEAPDIGGLGAIITAPLNTIRSLLNSSCSNLVLPLPFVNKNLTLPCMNTIYTEHFGAFFTIYQTIILAVIAYRCIRSIFFDIHGFTNPNDDRIEVMDL